MRIEKLSLKNFRGFEELEIDFPEGEGGLAVFIGANGSGKSSVLDGVSKLIKLFLFSFTHHGYNFREELLKRFDKNDVKVASAYFNCSLAFTIGNTPCKTYLEYAERRHLKYITDPILNYNSPKDNSSELDKEKEIKLHQVNPIFINYTSDRSISKSPSLKALDLEVLYDHFHYPLHNQNSYDENLKEFFIWFRSVEDYENEEIRFNDKPDFRDKTLETVRKAIKKFLPNFDKFRVKRQPKEEFAFEKDGEILLFSHLSHGERIVLTMVGDIARTVAWINEDLDNPLEGKGVVLIDEIEQHLHPSWQRTIIPNLRKTFPNIQFIVTTHSPQVLSNVPKENVFILEDFKLVEKTPPTYGKDTNSILYDLFGVSSRPNHAKVEFKKLYQLIDDPTKEKEAAKMLKELEDKYGKNDPDLIDAKLSFEFLID